MLLSFIRLRDKFRVWFCYFLFVCFLFIKATNVIYWCRFHVHASLFLKMFEWYSVIVLFKFWQCQSLSVVPHVCMLINALLLKAQNMIWDRIKGNTFIFYFLFNLKLFQWQSPCPLALFSSTDTTYLQCTACLEKKVGLFKKVFFSHCVTWYVNISAWISGDKIGVFSLHFLPHKHSLLYANTHSYVAAPFTNCKVHN